jgi:hypothetical protein
MRSSLLPILAATAPRPAREPSGNGRRRLQGHMGPAEIVPRDEQRKHERVILARLAKGVRQTSHAANVLRAKSCPADTFPAHSRSSNSRFEGLRQSRWEGKAPAEPVFERGLRPAARREPRPPEFEDTVLNRLRRQTAWRAPSSAAPCGGSAHFPGTRRIWPSRPPPSRNLKRFSGTPLKDRLSRCQDVIGTTAVINCKVDPGRSRRDHHSVLPETLAVLLSGRRSAVFRIAKLSWNQ